MWIRIHSDKPLTKKDSETQFLSVALNDGQTIILQVLYQEVFTAEGGLRCRSLLNWNTHKLQEEFDNQKSVSERILPFERWT